MPLGTMPKYIDLMNVTNRPQTLRHPLLANGSLEFGPLEVKIGAVPTQVWSERFRTPWLFRLTHPLAVAALKALLSVVVTETEQESNPAFVVENPQHRLKTKAKRKPKSKKSRSVGIEGDAK